MDNHDIIEFSMRSLAGVDDAAADQVPRLHRAVVLRVFISLSWRMNL